MIQQKKIFAGLKVVELAGVLAGPSAGAFFAELGADVIKIENPKTGGDITRSWKLPVESSSETTSAYYYSVNLLKKVIFADLSLPKDYGKVMKFISSADVLLVNFKKGDDVKFGLDWNTLKKINPRLIYAAISGFGEENKRIAYDLILQAESGFMSMNGTPDSGPLKMPVALIDLIAGHQLKEAILIALMKRKENKKGVKISVSLLDSAISSLANQASNFLNAGFVPALAGNNHPNIAPYGEIFQTKDKKLITFAVGSDRQFEELSELLQLPQKKHYSSNVLRVKNREKLAQEILPLVSTKSSSVLMEECERRNIPAALIKSIDEVLTDKGVESIILSKSVNGKVKKAVPSIAFKMSS